MDRKGVVGTAVVLFCVVAFGCSCNNGRQDRGNADTLADSAGIGDTVDSFSIESLRQKDSASIFRNDTVSEALHRLSIRKESWSKASLTDLDTLKAGNPAENVHVDNAFLKKYAAILKASPDGQYIIDPGSDNMMYDAATGKMSDGDPETNMVVLNRQTGEKIPLLQLGASGRILHIHWLDDDKAAILCTLPGRDPQKEDTYLYLYNARNRVMKTYKWQ